MIQGGLEVVLWGGCVLGVIQIWDEGRFNRPPDYHHLNPLFRAKVVGDHRPSGRVSPVCVRAGSAGTFEQMAPI